MATFTKRGEYQWQAKIRRQGHPGQSKTFNTKAEAEAWARLIEGEMDRGIFVSRAEAEGTTLTDGLDRYAKEITPRKKSAAQELVRSRAGKEAHSDSATLPISKEVTWRSIVMEEERRAVLKTP